MSSSLPVPMKRLISVDDLRLFYCFSSVPLCTVYMTADLCFDSLPIRSVVMAAISLRCAFTASASL